MSGDSTRTQDQTSRRPVGQITPELVEKVTDKVYAMLLKELRIENERRRVPVDNLGRRH